MNEKNYPLHLLEMQAAMHQLDHIGLGTACSTLDVCLQHLVLLISIKHSPLLHIWSRRWQPVFIPEELRQHFCQEPTPEQLNKCQQFGREIAKQNNDDAFIRMQEQFKWKGQPYSFAPNQWELLR